MADSTASWSSGPILSLPRLLVATDGREPLDLPEGLSNATFLRDLDVATLAAIAGSARPPLGLDIDSVNGLNPDAAAVRFVMEELGIRVVLTRRPAIAARVAEAGGLALVHLFAFDSTGLSRSLDAHPGIAGAGTVISPGPVLAHLGEADVARLPRPVVAYGLIGTVELARTLLVRADALLFRAELAVLLVGAQAASA